jgi:Spy/CpxP family protein refolding chaperone
MSKEQKAKITITLIAIFVAGALAGGFVVSAFSSRGRPPSIGNLSERQMSRMASKLELTEEQIARIHPIIDEISEEIRSVRHESMAEFARLYKEMEKRVIAELTPEQTEKFNAYQEERRQRAEKMLKQRRMDGERRGPHGMDDNRDPRDRPLPDPPPDPPPPPQDGPPLLPPA